MKKMSKKAFWARLAIYILIGGILPFTFLTWRFELFHKVSAINIGGWGIIAVVFIAVFMLRLMKAVKKGLPFSLFSQVLDGIIKVIIPLTIFAIIVYLMQNCQMELFQFLCVAIFCEFFAIPINPVPRWAHENKLEESQEGLKSLLTSVGLINKE